MTKFILLALGLTLVAPSAFALPVPVSKFEAYPISLYTGDEKAVVFTLDLKEVSDPQWTQAPHINLYLVDEDGKQKKFLGNLNDDGVLGDRKGQDLIFTRRVQFKQNKAGLLYFAVALENPKNLDHLDALAAKEDLISVNIEQRPTFIQIIGTIWNRIWHPHKS